MSDFHVVTLTYSVKSRDDVTYVSPPPVTFDTGDAQFRLADATLTCHMRTHFSTAAEARLAVEPVLRAWELDAALRDADGVLSFQYEDAEVIDRTPVAPGATDCHVILVGTGSMTVAGHLASVHRTRNSYPPPPNDFRLTPDVDAIWHRYQGYLQGREPLLAMAYFCLTVVETAAGGRREAATTYNIDEPVLRKLGELTSVRGDPRMARKMPTPGTPPLSGAEDEWIHATIKQLIWRLGDQRSPVDLPTITMVDLPPI